MNNFTLGKPRVGILFYLLALNLMFQACSKKPGQIGESIQPDKDLISLFHTDTIHISAMSYLEDSIRTDKPERVLLGSMTDPIFGTTVAGFYTQLRLSTTKHDFGENAQLDSLVLQLAYSGYYGDTMATQTLRAYELLESIHPDSAYYSTRTLEKSSVLLAEQSFNPRPMSLYPFHEDTLPPLIRIRLDKISNSLGEKLITATENHVASDTAFKAFFKGLYLEAEAVSSGGALSMFDLPLSLSRMTLYYKNAERDSLRYDYAISAAEARFNTFDHLGYQHADPQLKSQVLDGDTTLGEQLLYVQGSGGIKTKIKFTELQHFARNIQGSIIINEAKLIIPAHIVDTAIYTAPLKLSLMRIIEDNKYRVLEDQSSGEDYFGGGYVRNQNAYQFRLTQYVQDMVDTGEDFENYGLQLSVMGAAARPNRFIINGPNPAEEGQSPLRLIINYSVVKD